MRIITLSVLILLSLLTSACDSKTAALANKSLMSRPLIHQQTSSDSSQDMHVMQQTNQAAADKK